MMDIKSEINKAMVNAKRNKQKLVKVILGRKEKKILLEQLESSEDPELTEDEMKNCWTVILEDIDEESYFEAINEEEK